MEIMKTAKDKKKADIWLQGIEKSHTPKVTHFNWIGDKYQQDFSYTHLLAKTTGQNCLT